MGNQNDCAAWEGERGGVGEYLLHTRRIPSFNARLCGVTFTVLAIVTLLIGVAFAALGAWLILPFAGFEAVALIVVFDWFARHANDSESLEVRGSAVKLAVREQTHTRHYEWNRAWARLVVQARPGGVRLALSSHGREVEVGRYLNDAGKQQLVQDLKSRLGAR